MSDVKIPVNTPLAMTIPTMPGSASDYSRRSQARKRLRMMTGNWLTDLQQHLSEHFAVIRQEALGKPDLSTNILLSMVEQIAKLYTTTPVLHIPDLTPERKAFVIKSIDDSGWWSMAEEHQQYTLAIREGFVRPSITDDGPLYRQVTPDVVVASAPSTNPDIPDWFIEARLRDIDDKKVWTWDQYDVRDPDDPSYRIITAETPHKDVTEKVTGSSQSGEMYPYRWTQGDRADKPFLPYSTYHAKRTGKLWNGMSGLEAIEGTLTVAVLWTFWLHNVRDASWTQKYSMDSYLRGIGDDGENLHARRQTVVVDPASIMQFASDGDHPVVGTLPPAIDPKTLGEALSSYERRLGVYFGISPNDFEASGQAESGYAISLKREAVREMQRGFEPEFRRGDIDLMEKTAAMMNRSGKADFPWPETGWGISYPGLPRTTVEILAGIDRMRGLREIGLTSLVDDYMDLHPGVTREQALEELIRIKKETRALEMG